MEYKDYYKVLGVGKNASEKEIKSAFRKQARQYHPDVNPNNQQAEDRFKEANEAYEVLSSPEKRKHYDEMGADWDHYARAGAGTGAGTGAGAGAYPGGTARAGTGAYTTYQNVSPEDLEDLFGTESPFSDFFYTYFGGETPGGTGAGRGGEAGRGGPRARPAMRGQDVESPIEVTLEEAANGGTRRLRLEEPGGRTRTVEVKIPRGVREGTRIRIAGQGGPGISGGPPGDLYLVAQIQPHRSFERRGDDLATKLAVKMTTLVLGGEVVVPTLTGRVMLKIPADTPDGKSFRLRGKGLPRLERPHEHGDLYAEVHAALPIPASAEQRRLVEQLARLETEEPVGATG